MTPSLKYWRITPDAPTAEARTLLAHNPVWNCFALADLEPPLRAYSQFAIAFHTVSGEQAICLVLRHPIIGQVLSPAGNADGVNAILQQISLPENPLIQARTLHLVPLRACYRPATSWQEIWRMAIKREAWVNPGTASSQTVVTRLTSSDLPALKELYRQNPDSLFSADLFSQGLYFGVYVDDKIVAAGGTHVLVPAHGLAVLGHILTAPHARRRGYSTAITSALVTALFQQHLIYVILNVFVENHSAIRLYQRLGFRTYHEFQTGRALLLH